LFGRVNMKSSHDVYRMRRVPWVFFKGVSMRIEVREFRAE